MSFVEPDFSPARFGPPRPASLNTECGASHGNTARPISSQPSPALARGGNGKALEEGVIIRERVYNQVFS